MYFKASANLTQTKPSSNKKIINESSKSLSNIIKNTKSQSSSFKESSLISIKDSFSSKSRSSTLPFKRSHTTNVLEQSIDSSYASNSSSHISSCESSSSSVSATTENNLINTMTTTNNRSSLTDVPGSLNNENLVNSPIVKQPQAVKSSTSLSTSNSTSSSANTNVNHNSLNETSSSQKPSASNNKNTQSVSYLDDANLKLAVIDYSDILKLIKLQNSIEYQEWLAFNSKNNLLYLKCRN